MDREAAFYILDFVENIKDKISTNEYKEILEYISEKYNKNGKWNLYTILYSTFEVIKLNNCEEIYRRYIKEECLVRLTQKEYEIIYNLVKDNKDNYENEDIVNMYNIMYINNSIGNFNFKKNLLSNNETVDFKIQCPIILSIYKPKNIEKDSYTFEIDYIYSKEKVILRDITREKVNDIEEYKQIWLTMFITCDLSIDEYKYIIDNIFNSSIKILYDTKRDISFKQYNFNTMTKSTEKDNIIDNILFENDSKVPYVIHDNEKYYINTISYSENIIIEI
jgi:hypothetical protein